VLQLSLPS